MFSYKNRFDQSPSSKSIRQKPNTFVGPLDCFTRVILFIVRGPLNVISGFVLLRRISPVKFPAGSHRYTTISL